ncbi:FAD-binding oxidoreductase, partial [Porticoccaceae bacterium]|nr:FAD-binding oxidoreductase [Porticoccaceae bacterium]
MSTIKQSPYIIVGAGIHGLSTAYHLAQTLKACGKGTGKDIIVIDKSEIGSGASGIACGVIRNNYFQPAMRELMAHSVAVWETDPEAFSYHPVGYMQISCESMHEDVASIYNQQKAIDYKSTFIEGHRDCNNYMLNIFHDWQAQGITSVLHEESGGYANNKKSLQGLAAKAEFEGVRIISGVTVTGFSRDNHGTIKSVETDVGDIHCDYVVVAPGPWAKQMWDMLEMPDTISIKNPDTGIISQDIPMWVYWSLQEGTLGVDPKLQQTNDGKMPPVIHVDTDEPLYSDADGSLITDKMWGIYYKPDFNFGGIQGGAAPFIVDKKADSVAVDPYGPESPEFIVGNDFSTMWVSALA